MSNLTKLFASFVSLALIFGAGAVLAQEEPATINVTEELSLDEEVEAEDLDVGDPRILPDNPFYFIKNWGRGIQSFLAFDPVQKAELKLKFANEKLIEVKKLAKIKKDPQIIKRGIDNYQKGLDEIKSVTDGIKEKAKDNPKINSFLDKFTKHQLLHHRILQKLETQVPAEALEKIQEARENHLERFAGVMTKLEDRKEELGERLKTKMEEIKGSEFKEFKNLEVLKELEEKVPEAVKETIRGVREGSLLRLKTTVEQLPAEKLERFKVYTEEVAGTKEKQAEILENLKEKLKERPEIGKKLMESRTRILEKIKKK